MLFFFLFFVFFIDMATETISGEEDLDPGVRLYTFYSKHTCARGVCMHGGMGENFESTE